MSFIQTYQTYQRMFSEEFLNVSSDDVSSALNAVYLNEYQFMSLLSPVAFSRLEEMAQRSHESTIRHFGKTMGLYTPMYLSNYCQNQCLYCGFNTTVAIRRKKLSLAEVKIEATSIASTGLRHILVLTGDSPDCSPVEYVIDCVKILKTYFSSISIEIYALTESEYTKLVEAGVDGMTIYQETYNQAVYDAVHLFGPKKNYLFRLEAPERAAKAGMRTVSIGALLGLDDWRRDIFFTGLHAKYLQDRYGSVEIGVGIPRLRPHAGKFEDVHTVSVRDLVQIITALRIFLPRLGIALSTRESAKIRESLVPLGITRMSAGSSTKVGGHATLDNDQDDLPQFEISDERGVRAIKEMLIAGGYQPVMKDWMIL
jgi:2-iminoacetate synthase